MIKITLFSLVRGGGLRLTRSGFNRRLIYLILFSLALRGLRLTRSGFNRRLIYFVCVDAVSNRRFIYFVCVGAVSNRRLIYFVCVGAVSTAVLSTTFLRFQKV